MVANVQHVAKLLPPSPPVSEETGDQSATSATTIASESETSSISLDLNISERDEDHLSPLSHLTRQQAYGSGIEPYESASLMLSRSGLAFIAEVLGRFGHILHGILSWHYKCSSHCFKPFTKKAISLAQRSFP
ncbi:Retrovirus-related Pol polyprotein from transposon RE2 [Fusarium oxysporum f. sp. albedinis]|nr:Retrovirus-related Pol polyprotein from transposon RE2 [Fusarium oxysporum f. sp. albedinis]